MSHEAVLYATLVIQSLAIVLLVMAHIRTTNEIASINRKLRELGR